MRMTRGGTFWKRILQAVMGACMREREEAAKGSVAFGGCFWRYC